MLIGNGLLGIRPKAGFTHMPLTAHLKGLMPRAELTKVVGVPGSGSVPDPPQATKSSVDASNKPDADAGLENASKVLLLSVIVCPRCLQVDVKLFWHGALWSSIRRVGKYPGSDAFLLAVPAP